MPANLTPQFIKARERFHKAKEPDEKLAALEEMLATIPKHKGTDHMVGDIRKQIAKYQEASFRAKKGKGGGGHDHVPKEGAGQAVLVGPPNSGKSSLVAAVTKARPEIADYPFSTLVPVPGMMRFEDVHVQLVDLPPLSAEYTEPWVYNLIRAADLVLLVLGLDELELLETNLEELLLWIEERRIHPVVERSSGEEGNERAIEVPARVVLTKADLAPVPAALARQLPFPSVAVSARSGAGLDAFARMTFAALKVIRIYTKLPGKKPDLEEPYTLPVGSTALDAVKTVHRDFAEHLKYVRVWGSGRFDGQQVPATHRLEDGDIVEIHVG
jgi:ribosome-interacting GTPase 1